MSFICGSLRKQAEEDDFEVLWGATAPTATPKKCVRKVSKRLSFCSKNKDSKNPYANRGLDKFSALLADLDHKRQKILTQKGSEDISLLRFVYSENNDYEPIIVKGKDRRQEIINPVFEATKAKALSTHNSKLESTLTSNKKISHEVKEAKKAAESALKSNKVTKKANINGFSTWEFMKMETWRKPSYYLPLFFVLILIFLALFGRSVAILCTSIGWYVIPSINEYREPKAKSSNLNTKGPKMMKKEYARKMSEKVSSSPTSVLNGPVDDDEDQGRRKSF